MVKVVEGGPQVRLLVPAFDHHLVELVRAAWRLGHPVAVLNAVDHLAVVHTCDRGREGRGCRREVGVEPQREMTDTGIDEGKRRDIYCVRYTPIFVKTKEEADFVFAGVCY